MSTKAPEYSSRNTRYRSAGFPDSRMGGEIPFVGQHSRVSGIFTRRCGNKCHGWFLLAKNPVADFAQRLLFLSGPATLLANRFLDFSSEDSASNLAHCAWRISQGGRYGGGADRSSDLHAGDANSNTA
ncbi:hypothetical protein KM043_010709 [Ampulex compressa]|nr:hypothetical protein KM043_010709 [Ampulex compressa]